MKVWICSQSITIQQVQYPPIITHHDQKPRIRWKSKSSKLNYSENLCMIPRTRRQVRCSCIQIWPTTHKINSLWEISMTHTASTTGAKHRCSRSCPKLISNQRIIEVPIIWPDWGVPRRGARSSYTNWGRIIKLSCRHREIRGSIWVKWRRIWLPIHFRARDYWNHKMKSKLHSARVESLTRTITATLTHTWPNSRKNAESKRT